MVAERLKPHSSAQHELIYQMNQQNTGPWLVGTGGHVRMGPDGSSGTQTCLFAKHTCTPVFCHQAGSPLGLFSLISGQ